jgi:hypothetical protein
MPNRKIIYLLFALFTLSACVPGPSDPSQTIPFETLVTQSPSDTPLLPTATLTPTPTPEDTFTPTPTLPPDIDSLQLKVVLEPILFGAVIDFRLLPDGRMILTTSRGYATFEDEDIFLQMAGYSQQMVGVDDFERMWFFIDGDGSRIYFWDGGLDFILADAGWEPVDDVGIMLGQGVVTDSEDQVWLYTERDVRMYDGEQWTIFDMDDLGMPTPPYEEIIRNLSLHYLKGIDQIWLASCYWGGPGPIGGGGVRWYEKGVWKGGGTSVREGCALSVAEDESGRVWMGVDDILWRYNPKTASWRHFPVPEPTDSKRYRFAGDIVISPEGEPWASFLLCGGASCEDFNRFRRQGEDWIPIGEPYFFTQKLLFDGNGAPWIFGDGIARVEDNQSTPISELIVEGVAVDANGRIWVVGHPMGGEMALWVMGGE